jgi:hypothetical protein
MSGNTAFVLTVFGFLALVGFLCWLFMSGWPCAILLLLSGLRAGSSDTTDAEAQSAE